MRKIIETRHLSANTESFDVEVRESDMQLTLRERYQLYREELAADESDAASDVIPEPGPTPEAVD